MQDTLSWGLIIAINQREQNIYTCIELAVKQTYKPLEIIIVDASRYWKETRELIMSTLATQYPEIRWIYTAADYRSLPQQRNQGIRLATADTLFLFAHDLFMHPTCAEEIMRIYEADSEGIIPGVQASLVTMSPLPPAEQTQDQPTEQAIVNHPMVNHPMVNQSVDWIKTSVSNLYQAFSKLLTSWQTTLHHLLNQPELSTSKIPAAISHLNVRPIQLFDAYRMTYRRQVLLEERFEPMLLSYARSEDQEADYRASRRGVLVEAIDAQIYRCRQQRKQASRPFSSGIRVLN